MFKFKRKPTFLLLLASGLWTLVTEPVRAGYSFEKVEVHGHRGARAAYPENTIAAFEHALKVGADYLEMDVRLTRDHQLVITHDSELNPLICLGPEGEPIEPGRAVGTLTLAEIKKYDCGSRRHPDFPNQKTVPGARIPTLRDVVEWLEHSKIPEAKNVGLHIEIKTDAGASWIPTPTPELFATILVGELHVLGALDRTVIQSFDFRYTRAANQVARRLGRKEARKIISPPQGWASKVLVRALHARGYKVVPWTANTPEEWQELVDNGVDGIITDDPEGLVQFLKRRNALANLSAAFESYSR